MIRNSALFCVLALAFSALRAEGIVVCLRAESADAQVVLKGTKAAEAEMTPEALWAKTNLSLVVVGQSDSGPCRDRCAMSNIVRVALVPGASAVSLDKPTTWKQECLWLDVTREYARLCAVEGGEGDDLRKSGARLFRAIVHACWGAPGDPRLPLADPYVLTWKGMYYAYGTTKEEGFRVAVSDDLAHWKMVKGFSHDGFVFAKGDGFGTCDFWAPEVHVYKGRFYLFYSANCCCCVAVADSPFGPFRNSKKEPLFVRPGGQAIDNSLFVDEAGTPWMPFSDNERLAFVRLTPDLMSVVSNSWFLAFDQPKDDWQKGTEEGASVVCVGGKYAVLFSGDACQSQDYAVGVGVADKMSGPWTRISGYRFLHRAGGLTGTGHGSPFQLCDGSWRYVFHAHETPTIMGRRRTYVVPILFNGVVPQTTGRPVECIQVDSDETTERKRGNDAP